MMLIFITILRVSSIVILLVFSLPEQSIAADISLLPQGGILVYGEILPGDAKKLSTALTVGKPQNSISLNSAGGDIAEAIKMAEIVKAMRLITRVSAGAKCASACFFIWLNGSFRGAGTISANSALGPIGLHRPFLKNPSSSDASLAAQSNAVRKVSAYLESLQVQRKFIDIMMGKPSNDIYWLTFDDLEELGGTRPDLEELYIAKCNDTTRQISTQWLAASIRRDTQAMQKIDQKKEKIFECIGNLDAGVRLSVRQRMSEGWLPPSPFILSN